MARSRNLYMHAMAAAIGCLPSVCESVELKQLWFHAAGGDGRAEIVAYDASAKEFLVVNGSEKCVMRLDPQTGNERSRLDVSSQGDPTSVAASRGLIAVAVAGLEKTDPGSIVFFDSASANNTPVAVVRVAALPDMLTFTPNGRYVIAACEGEPSDDYAIDPEGEVSVIDIGAGVANAVALSADFLEFNSRRVALEQDGVRITGPCGSNADVQATVARDLEPEFVTVSPDGETAWVTLQENNALAVVDIPAARVKEIIGLGLKDHNRTGHGLDASDADGGIRIQPWPVCGMYQPDGIAAFQANGSTFLATANEGDARGYAALTDEIAVSELELDATLTNNDSRLADAGRLGNLRVSSIDGDVDSDGDVDRLLAFGARSLAIWTADGELVYDSGDQIEQFIAEHLPDRFNTDGASGNVDGRSSVRGPEPESVVVGRVGDRTFAFLGLERSSAVAIFDVTRPANAQLLTIVPLAFDRAAGGPHIAPEGLCFVPADISPTNEPLLAVACEVSGTTILFRVVP